MYLPLYKILLLVGSGFESHSKYAESIYFHNDNSVFVNLFIPSRLIWKEKGLTLRQDTRFPESETTRFTIEEAPLQAMGLSLRYPAWSGRPEVKINGKKQAVHGGPSSYITLNRRWKAGDVVEVTYPMSLHVSVTPDNPDKGAIMYGPIVLAANLGTEGMTAPAPFSDPTVRNDYYTYDYHVPAGTPTSLPFGIDEVARNMKRTSGGLTFVSSNGLTFAPLYDLHRCRYGVYWDFRK